MVKDATSVSLTNYYILCFFIEIKEKKKVIKLEMTLQVKISYTYLILKYVENIDTKNRIH